MNVLFIAAAWPNFYTTYLFHEVGWLARNGHRVTVVSLKREALANSIDPQVFGVENVPVFQLQDLAAGPMLDLIQSAKTHIVYAYGGRGPAELALRLRKETGLPYVLRLLGGEVHSHPSPYLSEMVRHASAICPTGQFLADVLQRKRPMDELPLGLPEEVDPEKIHICRNGVPTGAVAGRPAEQSDAKFIVGTIGRLSAVKRQRDLLEAVAPLRCEFPEITVQIIGGGELETELRLYAQRLGVAGSTAFTGPKSWHETLRLAAGFSVYVQPSEREGFCTATVDAASQGVPLILSRAGDHDQCVVPGVNGYLFDAGDVTALRCHLRTLLLAGGLARTRMGAASLTMVKSKFLLDITMRRIEDVLRAALDKQPAHAIDF